MRCCGVANGWCLRSGYVMDALCPLGVLGASFMVLAGPSARRHLLEDAALFLCIVFFCVYTRISGMSTLVCVYTHTLCIHNADSCVCIQAQFVYTHAKPECACARVYTHKGILKCRV